MKKIYLYGNWKMNMTTGETGKYFREYSKDFPAPAPAPDPKAKGKGAGAAAGKKVKEPPLSPLAEAIKKGELEIAFFPPFMSIAVARACVGAKDKSVAPYIGAQNVYFEPGGAFTGEISLPMLKEAGCTHVIIGHSERRIIFGESDELVAKKAAACVEAGFIIPVICYGETLAEREAGKTDEVLTRQLNALAFIGAPLAKAIYAYEPVWAIGTGKSATSAEAEAGCAVAKRLIAGIAG
ncbi:MAG: triose-phosphate isomerase, partial [Synergistaceae bacterium]|nr:triose-phosphate isomerase [Synergistaceae bacterium]